MDISLVQGPTLRKRHVNGFTLIELIAVMVILGILATIGTGFVVSTMESYQRTQTRALLMNTARQSLERVTRQMRIALPYSVRLTNNNACVQFMPIAAGGNYFEPVPDNANLAPASANIPASPVPTPADFGTPRHVTIGAMAPTEIYGTGAVSRAGYSTYASGAISLTSTKRWQRNSSYKRYYLLDNPQAFCVVANQLRFYSGNNVDEANVNLSSAFDIIAHDVSATVPFTVVGANSSHNIAVDVSLTYSSGGESMNYTHRVLIRNVP